MTRRRVAGANIIPWRLAPVAGIALALAPKWTTLSTTATWMTAALVLAVLAAMMWRATIDTDCAPAKAAVVGIQLPFLALTLAAAWWLTRSVVG